MILKEKFTLLFFKIFIYIPNFKWIGLEIQIRPIVPQANPRSKMDTLPKMAMALTKKITYRFSWNLYWIFH